MGGGGGERDRGPADAGISGLEEEGVPGDIKEDQAGSPQSPLSPPRPPVSFWPLQAEPQRGDAGSGRSCRAMGWETGGGAVSGRMRED